MSKTMCKCSDEKTKERSTKTQKFKCKKCNATAPKEKHLCKPEKI